jgi:integrase
VGEFLSRWLRDHVKHAVAPQTYERYEQIVRRHLQPALGRLRLTELRPQHVAEAEARWRESGLAPRTCLHHHRVLHDALQQAVRWQLLQSNPVHAVKPPRIERGEIHVLDSAQASALLDAVRGSELEAPVVTALYGGLRLGELLGVRWQDLNPATGELSIQQTAQRATGKGVVFRPPKTHRSRRAIRLPGPVLDVLRQLRVRQAEQRLLAGPAWRETDLIFCNALGGPLAENSLRRGFYRILASTGLPRIRLHDLRHTMASLMLAQGEHPKVVSERLGHATVGITLDLYSHVLPGLQEAAAERLAAALEVGRARPGFGR